MMDWVWRGVVLFAGLTAVGVQALAGPPIDEWIAQKGTGSQDYGLAIATDATGSSAAVGTTGGALAGKYKGLSDAFIFKYDKDGSVLWKRQIGTPVEDSANAAAIDSENNIVVLGDTSGVLVKPGIGIRDGFIYKYSPGGKIIWRRQFGTTDDDQMNGVASDGSNSIIAVGLTYGGNKNKGRADAFIIKYSSNGKALFRKLLGSTETDEANAVAVNSAGEIFVAGRTFGALAGPAQGMDAYVAKYSPLGVLQWVKQIGTAKSEIAYGVAVSPEGDVVVAGSTTGDLAITNVGRYADVFVAKLAHEDGTTRWIRQFGTSVIDVASSVRVDSAGDVFVSGYTGGVLGSSSLGAEDGFVMKLAGDGTKLWTSQFGTTSPDFAPGLALDQNGAIFVTGNTGGSFGGPNKGYVDLYLAKYLETP